MIQKNVFLQISDMFFPKKTSTILGQNAHLSPSLLSDHLPTNWAKTAPPQAWPPSPPAGAGRPRAPRRCGSPGLPGWSSSTCLGKSQKIHGLNIRRKEEKEKKSLSKFAKGIKRMITKQKCMKIHQYLLCRWTLRGTCNLEKSRTDCAGT